MMPKNEINKAVEIAKKNGIGKMYLIGSSLYKNPEKVNDYDFAVADFPPEIFFKFYGELLMAMDKNVDVINLSGRKTKFNNLIIEEGKLIYDRTASQEIL